MWILKIILMTIIFGHFVEQVLLLKCYVCNSYKQPICVNITTCEEAQKKALKKHIHKYKFVGKKPQIAQYDDDGAEIEVADKSHDEPPANAGSGSTGSGSKPGGVKEFAEYEKECPSSCAPRVTAVGCIKAVKIINNVTVIHRLCNFENNNVIKGLCDEFYCYSCHGNLCNKSTETAKINSKVIFFTIIMLSYLHFLNY